MYYHSQPSLACVAGAWKWWAKERTARSRETARGEGAPAGENHENRFPTPIQLPGSRCVICQKFWQKPIIRANNNNSERFFKFMPLVSASFHQSGPSFDGIRSIDNPSREIIFEQIIFPLIFISTIRQIFCLPPLLLMRIWCQIVPLWIRLNTPNFF